MTTDVCSKKRNCKTVAPQKGPAKIARIEESEGNKILDKIFEKLKKRRWESRILFSCLTFSVPKTGKEDEM